MFIIKLLVALVIGAIVYAILKPICVHFGIDVVWDYIVSIIVAGTYFFSGPEFWKRP